MTATLTRTLATVTDSLTDTVVQPVWLAQAADATPHIVPFGTGSLVLALLVAVLFGTGTYLLLQRTLTRIVIGLALMSHGVNVLLLLAGGRAGVAPLIVDGTVGPYTDPLPQAMALTAIVISFAILAFLLALAYRSWTLTKNDEVEDDVEDRRIARVAAEQIDIPHPEELEAEPEDHP